MAQMTWHEDYYAGSSDYPISHESAETVYLTEDPHEEPPESEHIHQLGHLLALLTPKQRFVVELSWGIKGETTHSYREISDLMGVTPDAVRRLYERGMACLRGGVDS